MRGFSTYLNSSFRLSRPRRMRVASFSPKEARNILGVATNYARQVEEMGTIIGERKLEGNTPT